jgi:long-chain acyl-CoA synthetase
MNAPWLTHHPPGVRAAIDPPAVPNLAELARASARARGDAPAFTTVLPNGFSGTLGFAELDAHADAFAAYLIGELGLAPGDRVALLLPNCLAYPVAALGVLRAGGIVVNTNPLYTEREIGLQLVDSEAAVVVAIDRLAARVAGVLESTRVRTLILAGVADLFPLPKRLLVEAKLALAGPRPKVRAVRFAAALRRGRALRAAFPALGPADTALFQYTGGTTGKSKGAVLSHGNLLANLAQVAELTGPCLVPGEETELTVLPLYHVFAFTLGFLFPLDRGFETLLAPLPRPASNLRAAITRHRVTFAPAVNTLLRALLAEPWFTSRPPPALKAVYAGGAAVDPAVREEWERITGSLVIEGYGLSEASPLVTYNPAVRRDGKLVRTLPAVGGVGLPLPSTEVRLVDDAGADVPSGGRGEILVRGPQVMQGYHGRPDETAQALAGGWLHTGDIGTMDGCGYLRVVDRKKDLIIVSGFNVYPTEVEECIATHPAVAEVAVIGIPDPATGEHVRAFVVPRNPDLTADEIRAHCRRVLAAYKVPRSVAFVTDMPKNPLGKVLRRELRADGR